MRFIARKIRYFAVAFLHHTQRLVYGSARGACMDTNNNMAEAESLVESLAENTMENTMETEPREELVPKRGNRNSIVRFWFGFKKSDTDQTTLICKTCCQQVVTSDTNMSNLFYHLKTLNIHWIFVLFYFYLFFIHFIVFYI